MHQFLSKAKMLKNESTEKAYSMETIREKHKNAYMPRTNEDDEGLELLYCEKTPLEELSSIFGRNAGAIQSRINKLQLKEKYDF